MRVELVTVGDELLIGDIVNGNAAWLGQALTRIGVQVSRSVVVGDTLWIGAASSEGVGYQPLPQPARAPR